MIFPFYRNYWQTQCSDTPEYLWDGVLPLWNQNLEPPPSCAFCLLYPFKTDVNVIIQNTPHHQNIIMWHPTSPHDAPVTSWSFWWELMWMHLVCWADILIQSMDAKADALLHPLWSGKLKPQAHTVTLSPRYLDTLLHQASQDTIY